MQSKACKVPYVANESETTDDASQTGLCASVNRNVLSLCLKQLNVVVDAAFSVNLAILFMCSCVLSEWTAHRVEVSVIISLLMIVVFLNCHFSIAI